MKSTTYCDLWPEALRALEAAILLHLGIEFHNTFVPDVCGDGRGLYRYALTVDPEIPEAEVRPA